ncbi:MAG: nickel pincer cofactor biosynthesis protein LarB [Candidatus Omnitrophota bacterium]
MDEKHLRKLLEEFKAGRKNAETVLAELKSLPYQDLGFARLDTHRELRFGFPEVIYAPGKTVQQILVLLKKLTERCPGRKRVLVTRITGEQAAFLQKRISGLKYFPEGRILTGKIPEPATAGYIMIISAGTADLPVAKEAEVTAMVLGSRIKTLYDVGVAGIHRLLDSVKMIQEAACLVVVAGMEGALPSVVAGISGKPVVGVPTSVGYGASLAGFTPLLTMLNSCSPNVVVVNIDNGFGAGFFAHLINRSS